MTHRQIKRKVVAALGTLGFVVIAAEWAALAVSFLVRFMHTGLGGVIFPQQSPEEVVVEPMPPVEATSGPDFVTTFLVTAIALATLGLVAYIVLVRYTRAMSTTGTKVVHEATKKAVPLITHKPLKALPAKRRRLLSRRVAFWVKVSLAIVPVALLPVVLEDGHRGIVENVALFVQDFMGLFALGVVALQTWLAARWRVRQADAD